MHREDCMTRHHLIPKFRGGQWDKNNIIPLHAVPHRAWHILYDNDLPLEILRGMTETVRTTLRPEAYELINGVLQKVEGTIESYNPRCYDRERLSSYLSRKGS